MPVGELIYRDNFVIDPNTGTQRPQRRTAGCRRQPFPKGAVFGTGCGRDGLLRNQRGLGRGAYSGLLELLRTLDVRVTFFVTGRWAQRHPDLLRQMADAGHEIGNHGLSHAHPKQLTQSELTAHIVDNQEILDRLTGGRAVKLYAPPYGEWDARIVSRARELGYQTVLWTVDTIDWQDPTPETIVRRVEQKLAAGHIVLMHPRPNTLEALPDLVRAGQKGLRLVPVGEICARPKPQTELEQKCEARQA